MKKILFLISQYIIPHRIAGFFIEKIANSRIAPLKNCLIYFFIRCFDVNMAESEKEFISDFKSFNEFFTRKLKSTARAKDAIGCVSPVDGIIADHNRISSGQIITAKNTSYSIYDLLAESSELSEQFINGSYVNFYLSPRDYHRIHMPYSGQLKRMIYVPGKFYSVNTLSTSLIDRIYTKNERVICYFETDHGLMCLVLIGAMFVGSVSTTWHGRVNPHLSSRQMRTWNYPNPKTPSKVFSILDEIGHFQMGSSVIMLWANRQLKLRNDIRINQAIKFGEHLAKID